jgi:hypothetical protein
MKVFIMYHHGKEFKPIYNYYNGTGWMPLYFILLGENRGLYLLEWDGMKAFIYLL